MKHTCCANKSWGIGTTTDEKGEGISYGYPVTKDPNRFHPDYECCSEEEIKNYKDALESYRLAKEKE